MAIHRISILQGVQPDNTGRCWLEPYDVFATNDIWKHAVIRLLLPPAAKSWLVRHLRGAAELRRKCCDQTELDHDCD